MFTILNFVQGAIRTSCSFGYSQCLPRSLLLDFLRPGQFFILTRLPVCLPLNCLAAVSLDVKIRQLFLIIFNGQGFEQKSSFCYQSLFKFFFITAYLSEVERKEFAGEQIQLFFFNPSSTSGG